MAHAQAQVPEFSQESRNRLAPGGLRGAVLSKEKEVNIRMWKEFPAAVAAQGKQAEAARFSKLRGEKLAVEPGNNYVHYIRTPGQHGQAITCAVKLLLDFSGFGGVVFRELNCGN
jgi:hypothetical protein